VKTLQEVKSHFAALSRKRRRMKRKESYDAFLDMYTSEIESQLLQPLGVLTANYKEENPEADPYQDPVLLEIDKYKKLTFNMLRI